MNTEDTQQFCLRWHNYQSSLLATLPQFLDGDDLTDVTLCAGSRSIKAHRVVLSACSEYFKELFKELGPSHHPVIVLPGVDFTDLCALVTFMYSGEVNIYEPQLASLLAMADTLHIRGLADFSNTTNVSSKAPRVKRPRTTEQQEYVTKLKTKPSPLSESEVLAADWNIPPVVLNTGGTPTPDINLNIGGDNNLVQDLSKRIPPDNNNDPPLMSPKDGKSTPTPDIKRLDYTTYKLDPNLATPVSESSTNSEDQPGPTDLTQGSSEGYKQTPKSGLSKMYTICFICGKQLSNHYNLRVHMETHQNVQYACSACNHVSRSRDALRKHVSYRHPPIPAADGSQQQQQQQQKKQAAQQTQP